MYVLSKKTALLTEGSLNPIIGRPNKSTLNNASVQVYKHGIRQSALLKLKIAKVKHDTLLSKLSVWL